MISQSDRLVIRDLASRWQEYASLPVMQTRKQLWKAVHDLQSQRPVILFETAWIDGYVADSELQCEDAFSAQRREVHAHYAPPGRRTGG